MSINHYYQKVLKSIREDFNYYTVAVWTISEYTSVNDAYLRASTLSSGAGYFSGSIGWGRKMDRRETPGGYYPEGDVQITASLDAKTGSGIYNIEANKTYLVADDIALKILRIVEARDSNEMVIYCERMNE